jgi:hypothetical protein
MLSGCVVARRSGRKTKSGKRKSGGVTQPGVGRDTGSPRGDAQARTSQEARASKEARRRKTRPSGAKRGGRALESKAPADGAPGAARKQSIPPGRKESIPPDRKESIPPGGRKESIPPGGRKESIPPGGRKDSLPPREALLPEPPSGDGRPLRRAKGDKTARRRSDRPPPPSDSRPSLHEGRPTMLSRLSIAMHQRTTLFELSDIAGQLRTRTQSRLPPRIGRRTAMALVVGTTLVLLAVMVLAGGTVRWVFGALGGIGVSLLFVAGAARLLPRVATRLGPRELPGAAWLWLSGGTFVISAVALFLTWGLSEATASLAVFNIPQVEIPEEKPEPEPEPVKRADADMKRDGHVGVGGGLLYVPKTFSSVDGRYDLVLHFHGATDLVRESIEEAKINSLLHITNWGEGSGSYDEPYGVVGQFEELLRKIQERVVSLGLHDAKLGRVALASWSAGYSALFHILSRRERLPSIDAVLLMDSLHGSFDPKNEAEVYPESIAPFVDFAERAIRGEKLFVLTHSTVGTYGYASTTQTANGLLAALKIEREKVEPETGSPVEVTFQTAVRAFPKAERNWLKVETRADKGLFHVLGCKGNGKGDHIAHLAQMSVTVLPELAKRWAPKEEAKAKNE